MLLDIANVVCLGVALVLCVPVALVGLQTLAAVLLGPPPGEALPTTRRPRVAVLVPAHDEAEGIRATLASVLGQLAPGDRLLVVADNCSDDTAGVAAAAGAEVAERSDPQRRGKGYALDFGIRRLALDAPEAVVMIDADCELHPGGIDRLTRLCVQLGRPVQALDLMRAAPGAGLRTRIASFAWAVKNHVRPLGALRLGLPCQLMGTGMAFPWALIHGAPLASGHIVEDMRLGLDLAAAGHAPRFCPHALVTSIFPSSAQGEAEQRARWERGHVSVILREGPRALGRALLRRRPALAVMVLDLCVPPITLLVLLLMLQAMADAALLALGGSAVPFVLALFAFSALVAVLALAWAGYGRNIVSLSDLLLAPLYVLAKLPLYARFFRPGSGGWVRARRDRRP